MAIIIPVSYRAILDDPAAAELLAEYSQECSLAELGETEPQAALYEAMEKSGGMQVFGVYSNGLVGFASLLTYSLPHYGKKIATTESIFIAAAHRNARLAKQLLEFLEGYAKGRGCVAILYSAPARSRFERLLAMMDEYRHSNTVFIRSLA